MRSTDDHRAALQSPAPEPGGGADLPALRALMRGGSKTFFAASLLLPGSVRGPATALYAFCRLADDAIDLGDDRQAAMRQLTDRLDAIYLGRPQPIDADRALTQVVRAYGIPRELLDALLEGFVWDSAGRRYETLEELHCYGARVAGTVGAMMALIMGARSPTALARACELGVAMQLTNIARDVGEDARAGRLYLPLQWLREAGIDSQAWLLEPRFDHRVESVVARLLEAADGLYRRSEVGIAELPRGCRPAIMAARRVYAEIGAQVRRQGFDSVTRRAVVGGPRKLALVARSLGALMPIPRPVDHDQPALPAVQFLVDAVPRHGAGSGGGRGEPMRRQTFDQKMEWAADLFARLADHDHDRAPR